MTDNQFSAVLNLLMCSDPWPSDPVDEIIVTDWANTEARIRGFADWIDAYMCL